MTLEDRVVEIMSRLSEEDRKVIEMAIDQAYKKGIAYADIVWRSWKDSMQAIYCGSEGG